MVATRIAPHVSRMDLVFECLKAHHGEPPLLNASEVEEHMEGSGLTPLEIHLATSRLVRNGKIYIALDGLRIVSQQTTDRSVKECA